MEYTNLRRAARRGFTIIELVVVIGIVGILAGLAYAAIIRQQDRTKVERAARDFQARIAYARALAESAGPLLGTPRFQHCGVAADNLLTVTVTPPSTYTVPVALRYDSATDTMTTDCQTFDIVTESQNQGLITAPAGTFTVAFTSLGRVDLANSSGSANLMARVQKTAVGDAIQGYGFRILPSGTICKADLSTTVGCVED